MTKEELKIQYPMFSNSIDSSTDEEIRLATDGDYIKQNPDKFLNERWQPYGTNPTVDFLYSVKNKLAPAGRAVGGFASKHRDNAIHGHWGNSLLYGGGLGALGGLGTALLRGGENPVRDALIGAALGAGVTYAANRSFNGVRDQINQNNALQKQSSFSDLAYIQQKIMSEPDIPNSEKRRILQQVSSLPESQISQLSRMLKTAFGAGVAAIISRFLGGGMLATIGGSILGGILGFTSHDPYAVDAFGRKKLLNS